uniref:helix-turn-helix domain-containing protein n=1 Tax=uncultured Allisonella sp. TaxID=339338 RepID=UPI002596730B|nr:helix-turn-helix domain-containing protein [uncultured Allisonella sp.]
MELDDVMTTSEAAERWGLARDTVKYSCLGRNGAPPRFRKGEFKKSGARVWLVTKQGMERLYGPEKK